MVEDSEYLVCAFIHPGGPDVSERVPGWLDKHSGFGPVRDRLAGAERWGGGVNTTYSGSTSSVCIRSSCSPAPSEDLDPVDQRRAGCSSRRPRQDSLRPLLLLYVTLTYRSNVGSSCSRLEVYLKGRESSSVAQNNLCAFQMNAVGMCSKPRHQGLRMSHHLTNKGVSYLIFVPDDNRIHCSAKL